MNDKMDWYHQLTKPSWSPPAWVFGPVWTVLYIGIFLSFGFVFYRTFTRQWPAVVALPFALNLVFNLAFTPIQFGLKSNGLATVDILLLLGTLLWSMAKVLPYAPWVTYAQIPYLLWVCFATVLQLTITFLNR